MDMALLVNSTRVLLRLLLLCMYPYIIVVKISKFLARSASARVTLYCRYVGECGDIYMLKMSPG